MKPCKVEQISNDRATPLGHILICPARGVQSGSLLMNNGYMELDNQYRDTEPDSHIGSAMFSQNQYAK
jgi:hypothetical protein